MNIEQAMIIKTNNSEQTELARKFRKSLMTKKQEVVLVPHNVNAVFITEDDHDLTIILRHYDGPDTAEDIDKAKGFDTIDECWKYAMIVAREAKLQGHLISTDIHG